MTLKEISLVKMGPRPQDDEPLMSDIGEAGQHTPKTRGNGQIRWKSALYLGSIESSIVLLFNVGFVIWAAAQHGAVHNGRGLLYSGECQRARTISTGFHVAINILGTILLGASNCGMQCLCAPTRNDVNRAHEKGKWLDIGVPSMRNLLTIPRKKLILWIILAASSLPLHLVYNSTIFLTLSSNEYDIYIGNKPFPSSNIKNLRPPKTTHNNATLPYYRGLTAYDRLLEKASKGELHRLENRECISAYSPLFQTTYGSLLLVSDDFNSTWVDYEYFNQGGVYIPNNNEPFGWICSRLPYSYLDSNGQTCSNYLPDILSNANDWYMKSVAAIYKPSVRPYRVKYCLSERTEGICKVEYSLPLIIIVIIFNLVKASIICGITFTMADVPILTTGDAVASFMRKPDKSTKGQCLLSRRSAYKTVPGSWRFNKNPKRWGSAVSFQRWAICLLLYTISITICVGLLRYGLSCITDASAVWKLGLGAVDSQTLIHGDNFPKSLTTNIIIANTPQAIFSILYFSSNSVFTVMTSAAEWSKYALQRKGLRVSTPTRGYQRNTFFLSLPYRYAVPLLVLSGTLHWLISQSLFLVSVEDYGSTLERSPGNDLITCGYSPVAIVSALSVGSCMLAYMVCMGLRRLNSGMPVVGSCSLAISAACHPSEDGESEKEAEIDTLPLQWGVVPMKGEEVEHCTFSSKEVELPTDGYEYE